MSVEQQIDQFLHTQDQIEHRQARIDAVIEELLGGDFSPELADNYSDGVGEMSDKDWDKFIALQLAGKHHAASQFMLAFVRGYWTSRAEYEAKREIQAEDNQARHDMHWGGEA